MHHGSVAELILFADHHQVHLSDEGSPTDLSDEWADQAMADHLATGPDAVAIRTTVNVDVAVGVELLDGPPAGDSPGDQVAEVSLRCRSGRLVVMGCTDHEPGARRFPVPAGWLRLRVTQANLDQAYRAGIDSDNDPVTMERLHLQAWPSAPAPVTIVRRWQPPEEG